MIALSQKKREKKKPSFIFFTHTHTHTHTHTPETPPPATVVKSQRKKYPDGANIYAGNSGRKEDSSRIMDPRKDSDEFAEAPSGVSMVGVRHKSQTSIHPSIRGGWPGRAGGRQAGSQAGARQPGRQPGSQADACVLEAVAISTLCKFWRAQKEKQCMREAHTHPLRVLAKRYRRNLGILFGCIFGFELAKFGHVEAVKCQIFYCVPRLWRAF